ncbi:MAG: sulfite exporter TauE/SafE family protein, partial [Clostridia bacterium]
MIVKTIAFLLVVFLANILQTITGFAGTALAMPFCIALLGKNVSAPLNNFVAIIVSVSILLKNPKNIKWKEVIIMLLFMCVGMAIGWKVETFIDSKLLYTIYGIFVILIALYFLFIKHVKIPKPILYVILLLAGAIHYIFISGGPLVVIVATIMFDDMNDFRSSLAIVWIVLNSIIFAKDIAMANITAEMTILLAAMICVV